MSGIGHGAPRRLAAFFTGFGKTKRIALFDTLIANHTHDEIVAVLAHEIGHNKLKHVPQQQTQKKKQRV